MFAGVLQQTDFPEKPVESQRSGGVGEGGEGPGLFWSFRRR